MPRPILIAALLAATPVFAQTPAAPSAPADARLIAVATLSDRRIDINGVCTDRAGNVVLTSVEESALYVVGPAGEVRRVDLPAHPQDCETTDVGIAVTAHDNLPKRGGPPPAPGVPNSSFDGPAGTQVLLLDKNYRVAARVRGADEAFFNGIGSVAGRGKAGRYYLLGDTIGGHVWRLDLKTRTISDWLQDHTALGVGGKGRFGGANGVKVRDGWAYYGSRDAVYRVRLGKGGLPSGKPEVFADIFHADDFDFAADGTLYVPTGSRLMKVDPKGVVSLAAETGTRSSTAQVTADGRGVLLITGTDAGTRLLRLPIP